MWTGREIRRSCWRRSTGGSIRGPSSFCGISGLKPTFGLVSKAGCVPLGYSLDNIGPMAHTVRDCALMLQTMAGYDPNDECSVDLPVKDMLASLDNSLAGVKIGVPWQHFFDVSELNPEVKATVLAAIEAMMEPGGGGAAALVGAIASLVSGDSTPPVPAPSLPLVILAWVTLLGAPVVAGAIAARRCPVLDDPVKAGTSQTWQGFAAGLVAGGTGALTATVLGTGTTALMLKSAWLLH